ncbi:CASP-like protein 1E1 [Durio zibethinus]|uniref:CASP-like protein n=1 Tax=Durio zibethinus TaxID=66656 RepID=A0A6P6A8Y6_DURZI|nr:CASP-like protein 1E1 [Durio zibethinus]
MESQDNNKVSGSVDGIGGSKGGVGMSTKVSICDLILRVLALLLTLAAAIVLGVDKQTKVVPFQFTPTLPLVNVEAHAKWHYLSAFVYSMVANIIACSYGAISSLILLGTLYRKTGLVQIITVFDLVMVGLLFSANGAALAIGLMGYKGNSHVQWNKVCNVFDKFCDQAAISIVLSLVGSLVFMALVAVAVLTFHKRFASRN